MFTKQCLVTVCQPGLNTNLLAFFFFLLSGSCSFGLLGLSTNVPFIFAMMSESFLEYCILCNAISDIRIVQVGAIFNHTVDVQRDKIQSSKLLKHVLLYDFLIGVNILPQKTKIHLFEMIYNSHSVHDIFVKYREQAEHT